MTDEYVKTKDCNEKHGELKALLQSIDRRLFKDNGNLSIQTRLDRQSQAMKLLGWVVGILCTGVILNLGEKIVEHFAK